MENPNPKKHLARCENGLDPNNVVVSLYSTFTGMSGNEQNAYQIIHR